MRWQTIRRTALVGAAALVVVPGTATGASSCVPSTEALAHPPGFSFSGVLAFGPAGLVGGTGDAGGDQYPVLWRNGVPEVLEDTPGGFVADINRRGDVLVTAFLHDPETGEESTQAYVLESDGTRIDLPSLGGAFSQARRMSEAGHVAGSSVDVHGVEHPVVWRAPDYRPYVLRIPKGFDGAYLKGINERGETVGGAYGEEGFFAHKWRLRTPTRLPGGDLPDGAAGWGEANVIDERGRAAGGVGDVELFGGTGVRGAVWIGGRRRLTDAPGDFTIWFGMSDQGVVAGGTAQFPGPPHALVSRLTGEPRQLVPLSGDPDDEAVAHAVSLFRDGDVSIGGSSTPVGGGPPQATVWHCAFAQSIEPTAPLPGGPDFRGATTAARYAAGWRGGLMR